MKTSKGYVKKASKNLSHPTERYDHSVPTPYKGKEFVRSAKFIKNQPNNLGDTLIEGRNEDHF